MARPSSRVSFNRAEARHGEFLEMMVKFIRSFEVKHHLENATEEGTRVEEGATVLQSAHKLAVLPKWWSRPNRNYRVGPDGDSRQYRGCGPDGSGKRVRVRDEGCRAGNPPGVWAAAAGVPSRW